MILQDVIRPMGVQCILLEPKLLPDWEPILRDVPVGCGIKGGIARKIIKVLAGLTKNSRPDFRNELNGEGDIDILVAVEQTTPELRGKIRREFSGKKFGSMIIEPKDIEVRDDLTWYFQSRDITMNEVLAFRISTEHILFFYTEEAMHDVECGIIQPSTHCLHTKFLQVWKYDGNGNIIIAPKSLARCIIRWVKGHGLQYGIDESTWQHYRKNGLTHADLFRIFRPFIDNDEKFEKAVSHLQALELLGDTRNPNLLWGEILYVMNQRLSNYGKRLTFADPNADAIELWIEQKEKEYREWQIKRETKIAIGEKVEEDLKAPVLLPHNLKNFPVFYR